MFPSRVRAGGAERWSRCVRLPRMNSGFSIYLGFMPGEENVIQKETEPVDELSDRPDSIKKEQENDALACEMSGGVF